MNICHGRTGTCKGVDYSIFFRAQVIVVIGCCCTKTRSRGRISSEDAFNQIPFFETISEIDLTIGENSFEFGDGEGGEGIVILVVVVAVVDGGTSSNCGGDGMETRMMRRVEVIVVVVEMIAKMGGLATVTMDEE